MQTCVQYHKDLFMEVACAAPTVICCRCTPTQKAEVVGLIKQHTQCITAAIGDGGNDVAMIQVMIPHLPCRPLQPAGGTRDAQTWARAHDVMSSALAHRRRTSASASRARRGSTLRSPPTSR